MEVNYCSQRKIPHRVQSSTGITVEMALLIADGAPPVVSEEVHSLSPLPLLRTVAETLAVVRQFGWKRVALRATGFVVRSSFFRRQSTAKRTVIAPGNIVGATRKRRSLLSGERGMKPNHAANRSAGGPNMWENKIDNNPGREV